MSGENGIVVVVENFFLIVLVVVLIIEFIEFVVVEIFFCNVVVVLYLLIKVEDDGYFRGEIESLINVIFVCLGICFIGDEREEVIVILVDEMILIVDLVGDIINFKGEDISGVVDVIIDLNGKFEEYILMFDLGEVGGVMVIDDFFKRDFVVVIGEVREENVELDVSFFKGEVFVIVGVLIRVLEEIWILYGDCDIIVFIGEEIVRKDLIGDVTLLMDLIEDVVDAFNVDLIGEGVEIDYIDFNGEVDGVLEEEFDKEVKFDLVGSGIVIGVVV